MVSAVPSYVNDEVAFADLSRPPQARASNPGWDDKLELGRGRLAAAELLQAPWKGALKIHNGLIARAHELSPRTSMKAKATAVQVKWLAAVAKVIGAITLLLRTLHDIKLL